jgi:4-carboxymuconolactone decarboxylase
MDDPFADGVRIHTELRGADHAAAMLAMAESETFGASIASLSFEFVFGRVWAREGLDRKQRSLVTIGVLVALGQIAELKTHG